MDLTMAIIIRGIILQVTDKDILNSFDKISYEYMYEGRVLIMPTGAFKSLPLLFKSYNEESNKLIFTFEPILSEPVNQILSKCTCVGVN